MIQPTSLLSYYEEVLPTLGDRQKKVLEAFMQKENFTNTELAYFLQWPINTVTPRVFELRAKYLLVEDKIRPCKVTGRMAKAWRIKYSEVQLELDIPKDIRLLL